MVVTEIATPTAELARVSSASMATSPATSATSTVELLTEIRPASGPAPTLKLPGSQPSPSSAAVSSPATRQARPSPANSVHSAAEQPAAPQHERDAHRGDRQQIRAHRHRPDDQDPVAVDHAVGRDHTGRCHEQQVAGQRARVLAGLPEQIGPDDQVVLADRTRLDRLEPQQ